MACTKGRERRLGSTDATADDQNSSGFARAPSSDLLAQGSPALDEQFLCVKDQPRGEQLTKRRGHIPLANGPGGENHRTRHHRPLSLACRRPVVHAELSGARVLAHASSCSSEPAVRQFSLKREAKVLEEGTRWQGFEQRALSAQICGGHPATDWRVDQLGSPTLSNGKVDQRVRLEGHRVSEGRRAEVADVQGLEAIVPRLHEVRARIDHTSCDAHRSHVKS
eukprot:scaffold35161_cov64-Phaeocystis_antarctica.AAC.17